MRVLGKRRGGGEAGQVLVLVAMLFLGLVAVVGLATDGGLVFAERRALQNLADAAALAGAMQLDEGAYRDGGTVSLNAADAQRAAVDAFEGVTDITYTVTTTASGIEVEVRRQASTGFLRVIGIDSVAISASARAAPHHGIGSGSP